MIDLGVVLDLIVRCVSNVQELTAKREDTVLVATDDGETAHRERLGGITLGENQRTGFRITPASVVRVIKLGNTGQARLLGAVSLLEFLALLELRPRHDVVDDARIHEFLDDGVGGRVSTTKLVRTRDERLFGLRIERRIFYERVHEHPEMVLDLERL